MTVTLPSNVTLRPCPLCGGEALLKTNNDAQSMSRTPQFWVKCNDLDCGVTLNASRDQDKIVKKWNTRPVLSVQANKVQVG